MAKIHFFRKKMQKYLWVQKKSSTFARFFGAHTDAYSRKRLLYGAHEQAKLTKTINNNY